MDTKEIRTEKQVLGDSKKGWVAAVKFVPLMVFAAMVIVFKLDLLLAALPSVPSAYICSCTVRILIRLSSSA